MDSEIKKLREQIDHLHQVIAFQENNTESIFKQFSENIDEVFWIRTEKEMIYINPAFEKVWGIPCAEIYKNPQIFIETIHPDDIERVSDIFKTKSFKKNRLLEYEYRIIHPDNQFRWIHTKSMPVLNDKGEVIHRVGVARDITEQKISQEETGLLAEMLDIAPNSITIHDQTGKFLYANQKTFEIHGYTHDEYMALNLKTLDVPESAELIEKRIKRIKKYGHAIFEVKHFLKDGSIIPLEVFVKLVDWKGAPAMLSIATDISERKKAEHALKESEEKFRTFVENANDIIYQITPEGVFTYVTPNWTEILGYPLDEVIGENFNKFVHPDDLTSCMASLNNVLTNGEKQNAIDYRVKHKNGTWQWHNSNGAPLKDENGNIVSYLGVARDITEKTEAQQKLLLSETKFKAAFCTSPDSVNINKLNGEFVEINEGFTRLTGYTAKDVMGKLSSEVNIWSIPEDREKIVDCLKNNGIVENFESVFHAKNGALIPALMSAKIIEINNEPHILSVTRDITYRKKFEQQIIYQNEEYEALNEELRQTNDELISAKQVAEESEQRFKSLIENAPDGLAIVDESGKFIYASPNAARHFGYKMIDIIGHSGNEYTHPDDLPRVLKTIESIFINPLLKPTISYRFKRKNGEYRWIDTTFTNLIADKSINGIILNFTDVTERKQILEDLLIAKEKAEESDRLKSAFLANMSHEIRTPMNGIIGFADLLKEPDLSGEMQQEYIRIIEKSGERMLNLINEIIDISKIESGLMEIVVKKTDINEQIEDIFTFFKPEAEVKGIVLFIKIPTFQKKIILKTDREKVYAILANLVKNAIKYTRAGSIEIGYNLKATNKPAELEFYVKDTGIGIPKNRHKAIFDRFIQADITDKMAYQGAGLGLSISKAYVEMLGGKIWVDSKEGHGSVFYFTLPFNTEPSDETINQQITISGKNDDVRKLKILIAEDDEVSAMLIENYLEEFSNEILKASSGIEAVKICRDNPDIDLIMMDIRMNGMGGYEATKQIRTFNNQVIIIAQTAYALSGDKVKSIEAGCNDYIKKPVNRTELVGLVKRYFGK